MESWLHTLSLSQAPAAARNEMSKPTFHPYTASADERIPEIFSAYYEIGRQPAVSAGEIPFTFSASGHSVTLSGLNIPSNRTSPRLFTAENVKISSLSGSSPVVSQSM